MSANEYLIDASTRHQIMLQRLSGGSFNKLKPLLEKLQKDIIARSSENPTDFQMYRLTALMGDIQSLFDAANSEVSKQLNLDLNEVIPYETDFSIGCWVYRDWETDRKSTRLNSSHSAKSRMPSSA